MAVLNAIISTYFPPAFMSVFMSAASSALQPAHFNPNPWCTLNQPSL